jgi:hypothetical protein
MAYRASGGIQLLVKDLRTKWRRVFYFMLTLFWQVSEELLTNGTDQNKFRRGERKEISALPEIEPRKFDQQLLSLITNLYTQLTFSTREIFLQQDGLFATSDLLVADAVSSETGYFVVTSTRV